MGMLYDGIERIKDCIINPNNITIIEEYCYDEHYFIVRFTDNKSIIVNKKDYNKLTKVLK